MAECPYCGQYVASGEHLCLGKRQCGRMVAIVEANIGRCCMCRDIGALENELGKLGYDVPAWFGKKVRDWMSEQCSTCQMRVDEARAETKQMRADYLTVADAVAEESQSPEELAEIARNTRRQLGEALETIRTLDIANEGQAAVVSALLKRAHNSDRRLGEVGNKLCMIWIKAERDRARVALMDADESCEKLAKALVFTRAMLDDADAAVSWNNKKDARDCLARGLQIVGNALQAHQKRKCQNG